MNIHFKTEVRGVNIHFEVKRVDNSLKFTILQFTVDQQ